MASIRHLLVFCVLLAVCQRSAAWWFWGRRDCPQQEHCPMSCYSGYVSYRDSRGCEIRLCRCKNVCEGFKCPENARCQKKFFCKKWGRCSVYPRCVEIFPLDPRKSPVSTTTKTRPAITEASPETTTTVKTTPSTTTSTTTRAVQRTTGGIAITQKTATLSLCSNGGQHLSGWICGNQSSRSLPCPEPYVCDASRVGGLPVCCPVLNATTPRKNLRPHVIPTRLPVRGNPESFCPDGRAHLEDVFCGRGGVRCPNNYQCQIDPADRYAVCCPVADTTTTTQATTTSKLVIETVKPEASLCPGDRPHLEGVFCGRGGTRCPSNFKCVIHPADRYAVCCPIAAPDEQPVGIPVARSLPMCLQPMDEGDMCKSRPTGQRWYFNDKTKQCEPFQYGGCRGNANNFRSKESCESSCGSRDVSFCTLPPATGRCRAAFHMFYYDSSINECREFVYGGCEGNGNRFDTVQQCEQFCSTSK